MLLWIHFPFLYYKAENSESYILKLMAHFVIDNLIILLLTFLYVFPVSVIKQRIETKFYFLKLTVIFVVYHMILQKYTLTYDHGDIARCHIHTSISFLTIKDIISFILQPQLNQNPQNQLLKFTWSFTAVQYFDPISDLRIFFYVGGKSSVNVASLGQY